MYVVSTEVVFSFSFIVFVNHLISQVVNGVENIKTTLSRCYIVAAFISQQLPKTFSFKYTCHLLL